MTYNEAEELLIIQAKERGLPRPEREYRFHPTRKWRFDLAWPHARIAAEIEGGIWQQGRHNRPTGFLKDCEKYNNAQILGWYVLRFPTDWVTKTGQAIEQLEQMFDTWARTWGEDDV